MPNPVISAKMVALGICSHGCSVKHAEEPKHSTDDTVPHSARALALVLFLMEHGRACFLKRAAEGLQAAPYRSHALGHDAGTPCGCTN